MVEGESWEREVGGSIPGQVMILGRNGTDDQDGKVEGLIAGAVVANTNVASAHLGRCQVTNNCGLPFFLTYKDSISLQEIQS